jgi:hypothetical protein
MQVHLLVFNWLKISDDFRTRLSLFIDSHMKFCVYSRYCAMCLAVFDISKYVDPTTGEAVTPVY